MRRLLLFACGVGLAGVFACGGGGEETTSIQTTYTYTVSGYAIDPAINGRLYVYLPISNSPLQAEIVNGEFSFSVEVNEQESFLMSDIPTTLCVEGTDGVNTYSANTNPLCLKVEFGNQNEVRGLLISPFHAFVENELDTLSKQELAQALPARYGISYKRMGFASYTEAENYVNSIIQTLETHSGVSLGGRTPSSVEWYFGSYLLSVGLTNGTPLSLPIVKFVGEQEISSPNPSTMTQTCTLYNTSSPQTPYTENCTVAEGGLFHVAITEGLYESGSLWMKPKSENIYLPVLSPVRDASVYPLIGSSNWRDWKMNQIYGLPCDGGDGVAGSGDEVSISNVKTVSCAFGTDSNGIWNGEVVCDIQATLSVGTFVADSNAPLPACKRVFNNGEVVYGRVSMKVVPFGN